MKIVVISLLIIITETLILKNKVENKSKYKRDMKLIVLLSILLTIVASLLDYIIVRSSTEVIISLILFSSISPFGLTFIWKNYNNEVSE